MKSEIIVIAVAFFCLTSCKNVPKSKSDKLDKDLKEIVENTPGLNAGSGTFTIEAPDDWTKRDTSMMGIKTVFINSPLENASDNFSENVNVVTEKTNGIKLDEYFKLSLDMMKSSMPGFEEISTSDKEIGGKKFKVLEYSHNYTGTPITAMTYFTVENGLAYVISCTAKKSNFSDWKPKFEGIVNTFSINK